jgi:hypothetical protein
MLHLPYSSYAGSQSSSLPASSNLSSKFSTLRPATIRSAGTSVYDGIVQIPKLTSAQLKVKAKAQFDMERSMLHRMGLPAPGEMVGRSYEGVTVIPTPNLKKYYTLSLKNPAISEPRFSPAEKRELNSLILISEDCDKRIEKVNAEIKAPRETLKVPLLFAEKANLINKKKETTEKFMYLYGKARMAGDVKYNGSTSLITTNPNNKSKPAIAINGINMDFSRSVLFAQGISEAIGGKQITLIYNNNLSALGVAYASKNWPDIIDNPEAATLLQYKTILSNPKAAIALANVVKDRLTNDREPIHLIGYSQGGIIMAYGLRFVMDDLNQQLKSGRASPGEWKQQVERIRIFGIASGAARRDFPKELQSNFTQTCDANDLVCNARNQQVKQNYGDLARLIAVSSTSPFNTRGGEHSTYLSKLHTLQAHDPKKFPNGVPYNDAADRLLSLWVKNIPTAPLNIVDYRRPGYVFEPEPLGKGY